MSVHGKWTWWELVTAGSTEKIRYSEWETAESWQINVNMQLLVKSNNSTPLIIIEEYIYISAWSPKSTTVETHFLETMWIQL